MTLIWRGPCKAVKASHVDPIAMSFHRRASRLLIGYNIADDGLSADVYRHRPSDHARVDIGTVKGGDPLNTIFNVASQHTPHDGEFFDLSAQLVMRRLEEVTSECSDIVRSIVAKMDEIAETMGALVERFVKEPCPLIDENGQHGNSGLPGGACEECMNTGLVLPFGWPNDRA